MKKWICLCLIFCLLSGLPVSAKTVPLTVSSAEDLSDLDEPLEATQTVAPVGGRLEIKAKSAFLLEPVTGTVLYEDNADEKLPPASITKIMSLILIMEALDRGQFTRETVLTAGENACSMGGSQIWLEPGETMTVDDLLKATVIASANDATVVLAEAVAGSEEGFVAQMNARAKELGMTQSHFVNCTGLDAEGHLTSAHDVGLAAAELLTHPLITTYSTVWMDTLRDGKSELVNTNKLVRFYPGATGLKTGTTSQAGSCLAASATRDGLSLVAVILGGENSKERFNGAKKLLDFGFANFAFLTVTPELPERFCLPVRGGTEKTVRGVAGDGASFLRQKSETGEITQNILAEKRLTAPVKRGQQIGTVEWYLGTEKLGETPIRAAKSVPKRAFWGMCRQVLRGLFAL